MNVLIAWRVVDPLLVPLLKRVSAPACDTEVKATSLPDHRIPDAGQLLQQSAVASLNRGRDLDHCFGKLGLDVPRMLALVEQGQQVAAGTREIVIARVEHLQL